MPDASAEAVASWPAAGSPIVPCGARAGAPLPFDAARSLFAYSGGARAAIVAAKYSGRPFPVEAAAERLRDALRGEWSDLIPDGDPPAIVPVPAHPWKYFRRGFNLPALIGASLARMLGWPFEPLALSRGREGIPQAGLRLAERLRNPEGAFRVPRGRAVPRRVLLLDDVLTSGATVRAAAGALKTGGADHIVVVALARAAP
jgi:predicted amidophosphoribosyltransferase